MATRIGHEKIEREKGHLYFVGKNGAVYKIRRGSKNKIQVSREKIVRKPGKLYFLGSDGYVAEAQMSRGKKRVR